MKNTASIHRTQERCDLIMGARLRPTLIAALASLAFALIVLLLFIMPLDSKADTYLKIGAGYKLIETDYITRTTGEKIYFNTGGPISARIEFGKEHKNWTYGVSHHSQWFSGFPVNDGDEYQKTEIFIDYKFSL